jgi:DNA repair exonuclease SbcCD ATPase subunit
MKLRAIHLENVRRFTDRIEINDIGDGLNVLCAPNEHGKSTVFDALHALFFKDRKSWDKEIRALAPHSGGDPTVGADVEIGGDLFRIEKRWTRSRAGDIRVWRNGALYRQADDAEAWLTEAVKAPKDGGPAGLLWVRQGLTTLDDGDQGRAARRDLMSSVAGEVEAITGGRRMDAALATCTAALGQYVTATGKARENGPLRDVQVRVSSLEEREAALSTIVTELRQHIDRRLAARRELADLEAPEGRAEREARLAEARKTLEAAEGHARRLAEAVAAEEAARREVTRAREALETLQRLDGEMRAASADLDRTSESHRRALDALAQATEAAKAAAARHATAMAEADGAAEALPRATRASAASAAVARRADLVRAIKSAESYRSEMEASAAEVGRELTPQALERFETLDRDLRAARRAVEAEAASVSVAYLAGREGSVRIGARPVEAGERVTVTAAVVLDLDGIGHLTVTPGAGTDETVVARAKQALDTALQETGIGTIDEARASVAARQKAEARGRDAKAALDAVAPDGIERLREALAALPEPVEDAGDVPDLAAAEAAEAAARAALQTGEVALESARAALAEAQRAASVAETAADGARLRLDRAKAALSGVEDVAAELDARQATLGTAVTAGAAAARLREDLARAAPDLVGAQAAHERAASVLRRAEDDCQRLRIELGRLDVAIDMRAGEAVEEELADVEAQLVPARAQLAALGFEVEVLKRLKAALETARSSARDRYVEPVKRELVPLLRLLWTDAELQFDAEEVLPTSLVRNGEAEDFSVLSGGTKEQIALLVRLAFARMLAKAGTPAPVILDDAIVYTDDDRIERMFDALTRQAQDIQILVFSCRQKAFRDLGGRSLTIRRPGADLEAAQ